MFVSVVVPSYLRSDDLRKCLTALAAQERRPDLVCVVVRDTDEATFEEVKRFRAQAPWVVSAMVSEPGLVAALNVGLERVETTSDIVCFTDDDACPRADWVLRIERAFEADSKLGGLGGRDWTHMGGRLLDGSAKRVGEIQWFGRRVGNHHLGVGAPRVVDVIKGANMSYRAEAIRGARFDRDLLGKGAQVACDLAFSLGVGKRGWKVVYDPQVAIDHYPSTKGTQDHRLGSAELESIRVACYNETLGIFRNLVGYRRVAYLMWNLLVGNRTIPGLLLIPLKPAENLRRFVVGVGARIRAVVRAGG